MNGTLYRIINMKNDKSYIGKTYQNMYTRLSQHIRDANKFPYRPLYAAMNKYGLDSFSMEIIGEFPEGILEHKEIEYIEIYNSYGQRGYNATKGGDGVRYLDLPEEEIVNLYKSNTIKYIANFYSVDHSTIRKILLNQGISLRNHKEDSIFVESKRKNASKILLVDTNEVYENTYECAKDLIEIGVISQTLSIKSIQHGIRNVCTGNRKSYKGLIFKYDI